MHRVGGVMAVSNRQVLSRLEEEVAAAEAEDDSSLDAGRPDDRPLEDLRQVVEQRVAAVLGGLDHPRVLGGAEREPVGAFDAHLPQSLDRAGDRAWVFLSAAAERFRFDRRGVGDPGDAGLRPTVEDGDVLGDRDPLRRLVEPLEVGVEGAPVVVGQLGARDRELGSQLDQGQDPAPRGADPVGGRRVDLVAAAEVGGGVLPAVRPGEVDQAARGERRPQALARLVVEKLPARNRDRRQLAQPIVNRYAPFRPPIPSEPAAAPPPSSSEPPSAESASAASPCPTMSPS